MSKKYLEDVEEETGISERNIKYWSQKYDLPVEKDGRRNVYPERTITLLRLIELLSDTELFTHNFIRLQVQRALDELDEDSENYSAYREVIQAGEQLLEEIDSAQGTAILPALSARKKKASSAAKRKKSRPSAGTDIDEEIL